jgi:hypothetical protein
MTGLPPSSPLDTIWHPLKAEFITVPLSEARLDALVTDLRSSLSQMHRQTLDLRNQAHFRANRRRPAPLANFSTGDFVLFSTHVPKAKLSLKWQGPARVIECRSEHIYLIENLITLERFECHAQRLRFYCDASLNLTQDLKDQIAFDSNGYEVEAILAAKQVQRIWKLLVRWRGLSTDHDSWEPLAAMKKDIPVHLKALIKSSSLPESATLLKLLS